MSLPAQTPPPDRPVHTGDDPGDRTATGTLHTSAGRRDWVVVALGTAFLAAAVVVSAINARPDGDLDLSSYAIGVVAVLGLLGVALAGLFTGRDDEGRTTLAVYPGAIGALAAGLVVVIGLDASAVSVYLAGVVVVALAVGLYLRLPGGRGGPGGALATAAVVGLGVVYSKAVDDLLDVEDTDGGFITAALVVLAFVLVVTALGWLLPRTRALTGVVVGAFSIVSYATIMGAIAVSTLFAGLLAPLTGGLTGDTGGQAPEVESYTADVYVVLVVDVVLLALWALAAHRTGHPGFRVLIVALTATQVPLATVALALDEPAWWGWGAAVVGLAVLALVVVRGSSSSDARGAGPAFPPPTGAPSGSPSGSAGGSAGGPLA